MVKKSIITSSVVMMLFCVQAAQTYIEEVLDGIQWTYSVSNGQTRIVRGHILNRDDKTTRSVLIPSTLGGNSVTSLGVYEGDGLAGDLLLSNHLYVTNVIIPNSVKKIECMINGYFDSITIGNSVDNIGNGMFSRCSRLKSVTIPDSVTNIGVEAFAFCSSLTNVTIGSGVTSIGKGAFYDCCSLANVTIGSRVDRVGREAFEGCHASLYDTKSIPGVALVDGWVISCDENSLTENLVLTGIKGIADRAFSVHTSSGNTRKIPLVSVTIKNGARSIGESAFYGCSSLSCITIPDSVIYIGESAFSSCGSLTSVTIPDSVTRIEEGAFYRCQSLANVTIPNSVTYIGVGAFNLCISLTDVVIPNGVKDILPCTFYMCYKLSNIAIPNSVTNIGSDAFYRCDSLRSVTLPSRLKSIGDGAFKDCGSLTSITIPPSVTYIGDSVFRGIQLLRSVSIPITLKQQVEERSPPVFDEYVYKYRGEGGRWEYFSKYEDGCYISYEEWIPLAFEYYNVHGIFPEISVDSEIKAALEGAADTNLIANITNVSEYTAYRKWALGLNDTTEAEVKQSPYSWLSYALDTDKLISSAPKEEDLKINDFKPMHNVAEDGSIEFELCASIDEIKIGDGATKDNLNKIFQIWGAETLEGLMNKETRQKVEPSTAEPSGGKVKFKYKLEKSVKPEVERFFWFFEIDQGWIGGHGFQA